MNDMRNCVLSIGSNMGDKEENLRIAVRRLAMSSHIRDIRCSSIYETEPVGYEIRIISTIYASGLILILRR